MVEGLLKQAISKINHLTVQSDTDQEQMSRKEEQLLKLQDELVEAHHQNQTLEEKLKAVHNDLKKLKGGQLSPTRTPWEGQRGKKNGSHQCQWSSK